MINQREKNSVLCDHNSPYFYIIVIQDYASEASQIEEHQTGVGSEVMKKNIRRAQAGSEAMNVKF